MNEQRQEAYISLINELLTCPSGQEIAVLNANPTLVDSGLLQALERASNLLQKQGKQDAADFLLQILDQLRREMEQPASAPNALTYSNQDSQYVFFQKLILTAWNNPSSQVVYPLLAENINQLNNGFIALLQQWSSVNIANLAQSNRAEAIAIFIATLGELFRDFPLGHKAINVEIAIASYEIATSFLTIETYPDYWAMLQNNFGKAYLERIKGGRKENIEQAISCFEGASKIHTAETNPELWAMLQNNLATAYVERIIGDKSKNLEKAVAFYERALTVYDYTSNKEYWAYVQNNIGEAYTNRVVGNKSDNLERAINYYNQALLVFQRSDSPEKWAMVHNNLGNAYIKRIYGKKTENIEQAIYYFNQALLEYNHTNFPEKWAMIQSNLGNAYSQRIHGKRKENLEKSIYHFNQSLLIYKQESFPEKWATTLSNLSFVYSERIAGNRGDNIEKAILDNNQLLTVCTKKTLPEYWAMVQESLGILYLYRVNGKRLENLEKSIRYYQNALQIFNIDNFPEQWADTQINLGIAYRRRIVGEAEENLEESIHHYNEAFKVYTREAFPERWARTHKNLGLAYSDRFLGDRADNLKRAINCYNQALLVYSSEDFPEYWADTLNNLGLAYHSYSYAFGQRIENLEKAINCYHQSLRVYTRNDFPEYWAMVQHNLGFIYSDRFMGSKQENLKNAIRYYRQALLIRTLDVFPERWAETKNCLGNAYVKLALISSDFPVQNFFSQAILCYRKVLQVYSDQVYPKEFTKTTFNLGRAYLYNNQTQLAYDALSEASNNVEVLREEVRSSDESRRRLSEEYTRIYQYIVAVCLELGNLTEAIEFVERSKTRNLVDLILTRDRHTIFPKEVVVQLDRLRDEIASGQYELQSATAENPTAFTQHLQELRQQRNDLQDQYLPIGSGFQFEPFRSSLSARTAIVEFYITTNKLLVFIITKQTQQPIVLSPNLIDLNKLENWVNSYLNAYSNKKGYWQRRLTTRLHLLAKILHLNDIVQRIPTECNRLIFIPHRYLHLLPLHALPLIEGSWLFDRFPEGVGYSPSCQLLQLAQKRQRREFNHLFVIQNPTGDLSYTDIEVETIQRYFNTVNSFKKEEATRRTVDNTSLTTVHCAHFSCHGYFNIRDPRKSALILANADLDSALLQTDPENFLSSENASIFDLERCLTLNDIFTLNLEQCRLVTLSACETGLIDFRNTSDEYIGLPGGFLYAGASSVVSSLWAVNDLSTALLMAKFYENLQTESLIAIALNQAQCWLRDSTKANLEVWMRVQPFYQSSTIRINLRRRLHNIPDNTYPFADPFYWAAFCAIGQP